MARVLWRKAPLVLLRHRAVLLAVACTALLVALAAASAPLLRAGAESEALKNKLASLTPLSTGLEIRRDEHAPVASVQGGAARIAAVDRARRRAAERLADSLPWVGTPVVTTTAFAEVGGAASGSGTPLLVVPMARTGATAHVTRLAGSGDGVWIANTTAAAAKVRPGDELRLTGLNLARRSLATMPVRVGAVYRALIRDLGNPYWTNFVQDVRPVDPNAPDPPTFLLMSRQELYRVAASVGGSAIRSVYELPVDPALMTLSRAKQLDARFAAVRRRLHRDSPLARTLGCGRGLELCHVTSSLQSALTLAKQNVASLTPTLTLLAAFAGLLALGTAVAAGIFNVRRRADEAQLLYTRGESRAAFAARAGLEALVPVVVGTAAGLGCALELLQALAPAGTIDGGVARSAGLAVAAGAVATLLAVAGGAASAFGPRDSRGLVARLGVWAIPWELPALAAAAALFVVVERGGGLVGSHAAGRHPRLVVFLLPLLAAAAVTGLATRAARPGLRRLRPLQDALFLAARRLAAARGLLVLLTVSAAVSFAALTSAEALSASLDTSSAEKAYVSTGADVTGLIDATQSLPARFPYPLAKVAQTLNRVRLDAAGGPEAELLAGEPLAMARVLHWEWPDDPRPALRTLARAPATPLPVVATDAARNATSMWIDGTRVPIRVVASVHAFPDEVPSQPLLVVPQAALDRALRRARIFGLSAGTMAFVWARGPAGPVERALGRSPLAPQFLSSADELRRSADVQTVTRTYGFLRTIAAGAGVLGLVALLLYLHARERSQLLANAFLRRMGLAPRIQAASLALEAGALVLFAGVLGAAAAVLASAPLITHLDPLSQLPPSPVLVVPWLNVGVTLGVAVLVAAAAGAGASLLAARADVSEALRVA